MTSTTTARIYAPDFTNKSFRTLYSNKGATNAISVKAKIANAIPAGGKIRFKLPRMSRGGKYLLWGSMGIEEGQEMEYSCKNLKNILPITG